MNFSEILDYYKRPDVQSAILGLSKSREIAGVFKNGEYSTRPNTLVYPQDILAMVKQGVMEFHSSLKHWSNPMVLRSDNYGELRTGWDLVFDLDCNDFEHGKVGACVMVKALQKHGIKNISVKFSGGTGWHIGIPWGSIPKEIDYADTSKMFPDLARRVVLYLKDRVNDVFERELLAKWPPEQLAEQAKVPLNQVLKEDGIDPWKIVEVDVVLISPRHLFRMPYSLNRKTWLVSLPVKAVDVGGFEKSAASPEKVKAEDSFLSEGEENEAEDLFIGALDWWRRKQKKEVRKAVQRVTLEKAVPAEFFPPCVKAVLEGVPDGRKRSVFVLINFLRSLKWSWDDTEKTILEWNRKNQKPLQEGYVTNQIRYARRRAKNVLPPNCSNMGYYKSFGVCKPDELCKKVKNPVNYSIKKVKFRKNKAKK